MQNNLTFFELKILEKNVSRLSNIELADLLMRPIDIIAEQVALIYSKAPNIERIKGKGVAENVRRQKERHKKEKLVAQQIKNSIERERHKQRKAMREPAFKMKDVDYSQMTAVRIDRKTIIYAKPGEDIQELKTKFKLNYKI